MFNFIIKFLGGITKEEYKKDIDYLKDKISEIGGDFARFEKSYKYDWLEYKSNNDYKRIKGKLYKIVKNKKPECDYDYGFGYATTKLVYDDGTYLSYNKHSDDGSTCYCGEMPKYGIIPQELAKEMYELANIILQNEGEKND